MRKTPQKGSQTAKAGFQNEIMVAERFSYWQTDNTVRQWLEILGYKLEDIVSLRAVQLAGYKTDVQVQVTIQTKEAIDVRNLQVKLVSNSWGFNQIDKRWVDKYVEMWNIPNHIANLLKLYTGEIRHNRTDTRDHRRLFANEFEIEDQTSMLDWIKANLVLIVSDIIKGRGEFAAEWILVIMKDGDDKWALKPINVCMNHFASGDIVISNRGTFKIGRITMQRKGGDGGRDTANMLQFKIDPTEILTL